ncbi:hypothetical protein HAX54_029158, partial [Datura stramonium]|nr:hypothetical protein [Datura stramonium]
DTCGRATKQKSRRSKTYGDHRKSQKATVEEVNKDMNNMEIVEFATVVQAEEVQE